MPAIEIIPIDPSNPEFGAVVSNIDAETITAEEFQVLRNALYRYSVVHLRNQQHLTPAGQAKLTRLFDPDANSYGHGKTIDAKRSVLHPDLKTIPDQPEVQVIGHGFVPSYEGLKNITLKHPHHRTFHKTSIPPANDRDYTRFYRWHIDAALYGPLNPPLVTSLLAAKLPAPRTQTLLYDDGTGDSMTVPLGTTAFVSGYKMFSMLTPEQKDFVLTSKIEYAPHPYIWISGAKSRSTGLGMETEDAEVPLSDLPTINDTDIQILPMCWRNPVTDAYALQIHPSVVRKIHLKDGTIIDDLARVRQIVYDLQRPGIAPNLVYAHDWQEGDLVLFNNHGVLHSVVGAFDDSEGERRLFRQCNLAASCPPCGPDVTTAAPAAATSNVPVTTSLAVTVA